jgi:hypothetical protein
MFEPHVAVFVNPGGKQSAEVLVFSKHGEREQGQVEKILV